MHIHTHNMDKIDSKWQSLMDKGIKIAHDEQNTYKLLKSSELVNILDVQKFISILSGKNEDDFLAELLAMDGFQGLSDHKNYIDHLKFGDKGSDHVQVIRETYQKFQVPVKVIYYALLKIYERHTNDEDVQQLIATLLEELSPDMANYDVEAIMEFYENAMGIKGIELKSIALTKLAQLKNQKKKSKAAKRKPKGVLKERKKSKTTQQETEE